MTTLLKWSCYNGDSVKVKHGWSKNLVTLSRHTVYMASDQLYFFIFFVLCPRSYFLPTRDCVSVDILEILGNKLTKKKYMTFSYGCGLLYI